MNRQLFLSPKNKFWEFSCMSEIPKIQTCIYMLIWSELVYCLQAYTVELECLVTQLEEENARLLRQEVCCCCCYCCRIWNSSWPCFYSTCNELIQTYIINAILLMSAMCMWLCIAFCFWTLHAVGYNKDLLPTSSALNFLCLYHHVLRTEFLIIEFLFKITFFLVFPGFPLGLLSCYSLLPDISGLILSKL